VTFTAKFTDLSQRYARAADLFGLTPFQARVVTAIFELGPGDVRSNEVEAALDAAAASAAQVRRALLDLYDRSMVVGTGPDGGPRRQGYRTHLSLTAAGEQVAREVTRDA
jgi:hypothetical protein